MTTETEKKPEAKPEAENEEVAEVSAEEGQPSSSKKIKGKKLLLIIIPLILVLGGAVGFYFFNKHKMAKEQPAAKDAKGEAKVAKPEDIYYDLDEFIVNLDKGDKQPNFLKMAVTLQIESPEVAEKVKAKVPLIRDAFQVYLRELRADDLQGSGGIYRLREELMLRVNRIMAPDKVKDILFKEILVQ